MISKIFKTLFVGVLCLLSVLSVSAQSASLVATDDVSIYASPGQSNVNHNHYSYLESYPWGATYSRRFLMKFDLTEANITGGSTITSAKVKLYVSNPSGYGRTINAHLISAQWAEGTATWDNFQGQFNANVSASTAIPGSQQTNTYVEWDVTQDVQAMVDGTIANHGWLFKDNNEGDWSQRFWFFHSSEAVNYKPVLEIEYELVTPGITYDEMHSDITCFGASNGAASVTAYGGSGMYNYNWVPEPANGQSSNSIWGLSPGHYIVTIADAADPSEFVDVEFDILEPNQLSINDQISNASCGNCNDGEIIITPSGGTQPYEYSNDNGQSFTSSNTLSNAFPGDYNLVVKDSKGCTSSALVNVGYSSLGLSGASISSTECDQESGAINITVKGGLPPYRFVWSNGATTEDISNLKSGVYYLNLLDANDDLYTTSFSVNMQSGYTTLNNMEETTSGLKKTSPNAWDGTAYTDVEVNPNEDSYVSMVNENNNLSYMVGFSTASSDGVPANEYLIIKYGYDLVIKVGTVQYPIATSYFWDSEGEVKVERVGSQMKFYYGETLIREDFINPNETLHGMVRTYYQNHEITTFGTGKCGNEESNIAQQYYSPTKKLSEKTWRLNGNDLFFLFNEPYGNDGNEILDATLYDYNQDVIATKAQLNIPVHQGVNKIQLECITQHFNTANKIYYLEFKNSKGEPSYLEILSPETITNCN